MRKITNFRYVPICLAGLIVGIASVALTKSHTAMIVLCVMGILIATLFFVVKNLRKHIPKILAILLCVFIGSISTTISVGSVEKRYINSSGTNIVGEISLESENKFGVVSGEIILNNIVVGGEKLKGRAKLFMPKTYGEAAKELKVGDVLSITGSITSYKVEASESKSMTLYKNNVSYEIVARKSVEFLYTARLSVFTKMKLWVQKTLYQYMDSESAGFSYAMLFGDKQYIDQDTKFAFSKLGTAHIFAVSGLHIGILCASLIWILKKFRAGRWTQFCIVGLFNACYCIICGFSPSVVRAVLMVTILLFSKCIGAKDDKISTVSLSCVMILLFKPLYLFELSFLMSFSAVYGLIFFASGIDKVLKRFLPKSIAAMLAASFAANIGLLPVMLCYFGKTNLLFVIANLITMPLLSIILPLLVAFLVLSVIPFLGYLLLALGKIIYSLIWVSNSLAKINFMQIQLDLTWHMVVFYLVGIVTVSKYIFVPKKLKAVVSGVMIVVVTLSSIASLSNYVFPKNTVFAICNSYTLSQSVIIKTKKDGNILIINGEVDDFDLNRVWRLNNDRGLGGIKTIVAYSLEKNSRLAVADSMEKLGFENFIFAKSSNSDIADFGTVSQNYFKTEEIEITFLEEGLIELNIDKVAIYFSDGYLGEDRLQEGNFVFSTNLGSEIEFGVAGYLSLGFFDTKQTLTNFTFRAKNGKIEKIKTYEVV